MSTRPSDYRPSPDSPHVEIDLPWPHTATPSGVVAWWFRKSSGVCEIVARTARFQMIALFSASDRVLVVWEQLQTSVRFGELHLMSRCKAVANLFPRVDYQVVACSRRDE
ncbi:hypothetical protein DEO72_LG10g3238 [Vigna unguiculata]|uniref:Uncharacterized protein n=1 Tax=Vigna unguiculata TaxID=3917 RepID=A0A4D6NHE8_VIGUN|nr:hypothetical protein DEO72_LG10g3238 [Vigna unguiculata]